MLRKLPLVIALLASSWTVHAQVQQLGENVTYAYAQVLRVAPAYEGGKIIGYDVEYQYKGEKYMSRLDADPGSRLRIRISVVPDDGVTGYR